MVRLIEKPRLTDFSVTSDSMEARRHYGVSGTRDAAYAEALVFAGSPAIMTSAHGVVYRRGVAVTQTAYDQFDGEVTYGRKNEAGDYTWDFDTTGGTVHITQAKEHIYRYSSSTSEAGSSAATAIPKHNGSIGVDKDEVKGADIVIPAMKINVHFRHPLGQVTMAWAKVLADATGKVNSTAFLSWAAGEVLFLGARGADGSQAEATISYQFAMSKNATGLSIGAIAGVAKLGWEYLWITYSDEVSASAAAKPPKYAYVERVYDTDDLAGILGFG